MFSAAGARGTRGPPHLEKDTKSALQSELMPNFLQVPLSFLALFPVSHFQTSECNSSRASVRSPQDGVLPWAAVHTPMFKFLQARR